MYMTHVITFSKARYTTTVSTGTKGKTAVLDRHQKYTYLFPFHAKRARVRVEVVVRFGSLSVLRIKDMTFGKVNIFFKFHITL